MLKQFVEDEIAAKKSEEDDINGKKNKKLIRMGAVTALLKEYIPRLTTMIPIFLIGRLFQKMKTFKACKLQMPKIKRWLKEKMIARPKKRLSSTYKPRASLSMTKIKLLPQCTKICHELKLLPGKKSKKHYENKLKGKPEPLDLLCFSRMMKMALITTTVKRLTQSSSKLVSTTSLKKLTLIWPSKNACLKPGMQTTSRKKD